VPAYLFHRYQTEAAASLIGGLYYYHTVRGGAQRGPVVVPGDEQRRALEVLLRTIHPKTLALPEGLLGVIPPRPSEMGQTRDLFPGRTGSPFDPLGAAEAAATLTVELLLHPERAARLVEHHSRDPAIPGLVEVLDGVISSTWKTSNEGGYHAEIQRVVDGVLLYRLMGLALNEEASASVRAVAYMKLDELKDWLTERVGSTEDGAQRAHYLYGASQIRLFQENPDKVKLTVPLTPPQGPPI
jgi:hypothetical protein